MMFVRVCRSSVSCRRRMVSSLLMPSLSPTMTQGTIAAWKKQPGDELRAGDILCEIETDKASVGFEVQDDGVLAKILAPAHGGELKVGAPIAVIVDDLKAYQAYVASGSPTPAGTAPAVSAPAVSAPAPGVPTTNTTAAATNGEVLLLPAARHLLESKALSPNGVVGTSKGGRISKGDVLLALQKGVLSPATTTTTAATTTAASAATPNTVSQTAQTKVHLQQDTLAEFTPSTEAANSDYVDIPNNNMRKVIAKRLTESKATVPHFYTAIECEIDTLMATRKLLKNNYGVNVSVNDLVIKSAALALHDLQRVNSKWSSKENRVDSDTSAQVDISVAVATPNGLITPIVAGAHGLGVSEVGNVVKDLAGRAREGKLKPHEYQGGSFSISNLGMFGIEAFSAVINPPQACILAVGGGVTRIAPPTKTAATAATTTTAKSQPRVVTTVTAQLSADRRVVSEAQAAEFLQVFSRYLCDPKNLLLA